MNRKLVAVAMLALVASTSPALDLDDIGADFDRSSPDFDSVDFGSENPAFIEVHIRATVEGALRRAGIKGSSGRIGAQVSGSKGTGEVNICGVEAEGGATRIVNSCIIGTVVVEGS